MHVCRVCLAQDRKLYDIDSCNLKRSYETLTNCLLPEDGMSKRLCWECRGRLRSCAQFRDKALRSQAILSAMAPFNEYNINQKLASIDRVQYNLISPLTTTILDGDIQKKNLWLVVKLEDSPTQLESPGVWVKEERDSDSSSETCSGYTEHEVKQEVVVGPETLQPQDIAFGEAHHPQKAVSVKTEIHPMRNKGKLNKFKLAKKGRIEQVMYNTINSQDNVQKDAAAETSSTHSVINVTSVSDTAVFICNECDKSFGVKSHLETHLHTHTLKTFSCRPCNSTFQSKPSFQEHMKSQHHVKYLSCKYCDFESAHKNSLLRHLIAHAKQKPYECDCCDYKAARLSHMKRHLASEHPGLKFFKCSYCSYTSDRRSRLRAHESTHTGKKAYQCDLCDYKYAQKKDIKEHLLSIHGVKPFQCSHCSYTCNRKCNLLIHERTHTGERPFMCDLCDYKAARKTDIKQHKSTVHAGLKPFKCSQCSYTCSQKGRLQVHGRTHTGEKPYSCDFCDYRSVRLGDLKQHSMSVHTDMKPFKCSHCSYACSQKSHLVKHERTHTGVKPYGCDHCDYKTARSNNLKRHLDVCVKL